MSSDDPFYQARRTIKETVEQLKKTIETAPKPAIIADWERLAETQRVRHKPSGCIFEWFFKDEVVRGRETKMMVLRLLECPSDIEPHELEQISGWANLMAFAEATNRFLSRGGLWW